MRAVFLPLWSKGNPYQSLLASHLEAHGVEVLGGRGSSAWLLGPALGHWRADVLHFHWVSSLFDRRSGLVTSFRCLAVLLLFYRGGKHEAKLRGGMA